jgi:site-specific DNA-methyltransferase (adenine-specific)
VRIVTVARKPCSEASTTANVAEHGCGALNIDGCRVAGPSWTRSTGTLEDIRGGRYGTASEDRILTGPREMPVGGRWPANIVLVHSPNCKIVGTRKIPTGTAVRRNVDHSTKGLISYARGTKDAEMRDDVTYGGDDGKETVLVWCCDPGCPVADLDRQSGLLTSGTGAVKRRSAGDQEGNRGAAYGAESRNTGTPMVCYGDSGGASRFFKCVRLNKKP